MGLLKDTSDVVNSILKWINGCNYTPPGNSKWIQWSKWMGPLVLAENCTFFYGNETFSDF